MLKAVTGFARGLSAAAGTGRSSFTVEVGLAHLAHTPTVLVVLTLGAPVLGGFDLALYRLLLGAVGPA